MPDKSPQRHNTKKVGRSLQDKRHAKKAKKAVKRSLLVSPLGEELDPTVTEVPQRRCWRCLQMFPGDATRTPTRTPEWWLCEPCDRILLGAKHRAT
jgi:hypothetical protein